MVECAELLRTRWHHRLARKALDSQIVSPISKITWIFTEFVHKHPVLHVNIVMFVAVSARKSDYEQGKLVRMLQSSKCHKGRLLHYFPASKRLSFPPFSSYLRSSLILMLWSIWIQEPKCSKTVKLLTLCILKVFPVFKVFCIAGMQKKGRKR